MGDRVEGLGHRVADPRLETADIYRVSKLKLIRRGEEQALAAPWHGVPPPLPAYRERGHRRLAVTTYDSKCNSCIWGCAMPVEMIIDQWNPDRRRYRTENLLLRTSVLFQLQARSHPKGSRSPRHDL